MAKNYVESKVAKKKTVMKAGWLLIVLAVIAIFILIKFALSGSTEFNSTGLPNNEDAYSVSQDFIRATVRSPEVIFPESGFQIAKRDDSTYVIRTNAELTGDNGDKKTANFKLLMQYKGGKHDLMKNWALLNISEQ